MELFEDPSLHLAVLEAAWKEGLVPAFDRAAFYRQVVGREWDAERDGQDVDNAVLQALLAIPLPPVVLEGIEEIVWAGGHVAQHLVFDSWDGEDATFDVGDLSGIGACRNLRVLDLACQALESIEPLRHLERLERFTLGYPEIGVSAAYQGKVLPTAFEGGGLADLSPLVDLPALRKLRIGDAYRDDESNRRVLAQLKARGVELETREDRAARKTRENEAWLRKHALDKGLAAFAAKRFDEAVAALAPHEAALEPTVMAKLQYARKRIAQP